ncbi:MAG: DUF763 domain-containing protein [Kiritimatiellia bacterium]
MKHYHTDLPLHSGRAPRWLFERMIRLAGCLAEAMVGEIGADAFLDRLADPFWFQCLGCLLGFDWHSSGVTTTTCGALKEGIRGKELALGLFIAGGKGATSRKTPEQIRTHALRIGADGERLVYASRMAAKVDSAAVQDGFELYHHCFFFTASCRWAVIQQGLNEQFGRARRYHWLGDREKDFVCEPHSAICSDATVPVLNMVAVEAEASRCATTEISRLPTAKVLQEFHTAMASHASLQLPARHNILRCDITPERLGRILLKTYERQPEKFETLLGIPGVGARTIRALSLLSELMYGAKPSFRDPARFSFAHGGKDGTPYPVDRRTYDQTIRILESAVAAARVGRTDKLQALQRLNTYLQRADTADKSALTKSSPSVPAAL